jgi:hypothetical protein
MTLRVRALQIVFTNYIRYFAHEGTGYKDNVEPMS